jgi:GPN-loop GTPase
MGFGQLVIGPPGSGKTTYCNGMQQYLQLTRRKVAVINLDPANDALPYECAVDVADLISLEQVQKELGLGPNGGTAPNFRLFSLFLHSLGVLAAVLLFRLYC